jgi:hypothetical protein
MSSVLPLIMSAVHFIFSGDIETYTVLQMARTDQPASHRPASPPQQQQV